LRPRVIRGRVGRGDLGARNGIFCAVFDQERKQSEAGVDQECDDEDVDQQEDDKSATHDGCAVGMEVPERGVDPERTGV